VAIRRTRDAPETDFAGYPAGRISGQSKTRISGWIFISTFKCLVKYVINKGIRCIEGYFSLLKTWYGIFSRSKQYLKFSRRHFMNSYGCLFNLAGYPAIFSKSKIWYLDINKGQIICPDIRCNPRTNTAQVYRGLQAGSKKRSGCTAPNYTNASTGTLPLRLL
jgi:hypothetical protein